MGIVDHARDLAELIKKYNDQDLYERIVKLRDEILDLRETNLKLKDELATIKATLECEVNLVRDGNCYYKADDDGRANPYCLQCWDYERKLVSLILQDSDLIICRICAAR